MVIDFGSFYDFPRLVNSLLSQLESPHTALRSKVHFPPLNISENDDQITIKALIPGADINDIELTLSNNLLCLKGEILPKQGNYHFQERPTGAFTRAINITVPIEADKIAASMKDGVLTITLPKTASSRPRAIHIQSN